MQISVFLKNASFLLQLTVKILTNYNSQLSVKPETHGFLASGARCPVLPKMSTKVHFGIESVKFPWINDSCWITQADQAKWTSNWNLFKRVVLVIYKIYFNLNKDSHVNMQIKFVLLPIKIDFHCSNIYLGELNKDVQNSLESLQILHSEPYKRIQL